MLTVFLALRQGSNKSSEVKPSPPLSLKSPRVISTNPEANGLISQQQTIEIIFNQPLENIGEFKHRIEPKIDYKLDLSSDRKIVKILPQKPYELGTEYTLFIMPESKFDGGERLDKEVIFHFKTVRYRGV